MHDITITIKADEKLLTLGEKLLAAVNKQKEPSRKEATPAQGINEPKTTPSPVQAVTTHNQVAQQPAPTVTVAPIQQPAPTAAPAPYTLEQLSLAAAPLLDAGKTEELSAIMQSFGVVSLQQLPAERYGEFATAIRSLGAQI